LAEHLEEQFSAGFGEWHETQLVNDEQLITGDLFLEAQQLSFITSLDRSR